MEINCEQIVEHYLLNKNPLYAFRFPLSILISIILFGVTKAYKWSENSYINQILIPVLTFLASMVVLDLISRYMISHNEMIRLVQLCKLWMHDPSVKNNPILNKMIDMNSVLKYNNNVEKFTIQDNIYNFDMENNINNVNNNTYNMKHNVDTENNMESNGEVNIELDRGKNIYVENIENPISEIPNIFPQPLDFKNDNALCIESSGPYNLCSGSNSNPYNLIAPIPGPQWLPQTAEVVQNRLKNNDYTEGSCM